MALPYTRVNFVDGTTPLNAANLNTLDAAIKDLSDRAPAAAVVNGQWIKGAGGVAVWSAITEADVTGLTADLAAKEATANKGAANGYASLDSSGKVPSSQLPSISGVYDRVTAALDIASTAAETSLYSKVIAANDLGTNKMLRLTVLGDILHNNVNTDTLTFRVKFGGTTFFANTFNWGGFSSANRMPFVVLLFLANLGATNSQMIEGYWAGFGRGDMAAPTTGIGLLGGAATTAIEMAYGISTLGTIDTTANQTLDVTGQWSASNANNSFRRRYAVAELI